MLGTQFDLETELRHALEREDFQLHYQPIIDLNGGQLVGFEALLRWMHPVRGMIQPADFLPAVEDTAFIILFTQWALLEVGKQIARWQAAWGKVLPIAVSMNISPYYLVRRNLVHDIATIAANHHIGCSAFGVEIAESRMVEHEEVIARHLSQLRGTEIGLIIDDVGTAGSPVVDLARLPVTALKIDRSVIRALPGDAARDKTAAVLSLARHLGCKTIAKGVERKSQFAALRELGCEYGQGFYLSPAVDEDAAYMMIAENLRSNGGNKIDPARLRSFELFGDLDEPDLCEIAETCDEIPVPPDTTVIRQGQFGNRIYFLESGTVAVYKRHGELNKLLVTLDAPTVLGEMAIVDPERIRTADVRAVTPLTVLSMPIPAFCSFLRRFPALESGFRHLLQKRSAKVPTPA